MLLGGSTPGQPAPGVSQLLDDRRGKWMLVESSGAFGLEQCESQSRDCLAE